MAHFLSISEPSRKRLRSQAMSCLITDSNICCFLRSEPTDGMSLFRGAWIQCCPSEKCSSLFSAEARDWTKRNDPIEFFELLQQHVQELLAMPKLNGILETALYVDDLRRSARFYKDIFGFEVIDSGNRLCALGIGPGQVLLLFKKGASADLPVGATDGEGQLHLAFAISAEELDAWESWLAKQRVAVELRRTWERGGRSIYFRDPDGHLLELATPGVWSVY